MKINLHPLSLLVFFPLTLCGMITDADLRKRVNEYRQEEARIANSGTVRISQILLYGHKKNVLLNDTPLTIDNWGVLADDGIEVPDEGIILAVNGYTTDKYESWWRSLGLRLGIARTMVHEQFKITPTTFTALTNIPKKLELHSWLTENGEWHQQTETVSIAEYNPRHLGGSLILQVHINATSMPRVRFMPGVYGLHLQ